MLKYGSLYTRHRIVLHTKIYSTWKCCVGHASSYLSSHFTDYQMDNHCLRATVEAALMEQRILAKIRSVVPELCTGDSRYSSQLSEMTDTIRALTKLVEDMKGVTLPDITVCSDYLVSGLYGVDNSAFTASTTWSYNPKQKHGPEQSRLYHETTGVITGSWSSGINNVQQYIQVEFPRETVVETILVRGRNEVYSQWVSTYHLLYSMDGTTWNTVMSNHGGPRLFTGNSDRTAIVKSSLVPSITAVYLRINPRSWNVHISLRFDVSGCYTVKETRKRIHKALGFRPVLNGVKLLYRVNERELDQSNAAALCTQQYSQLIRIDSEAVMASLQAVVEGNDILKNAHNQVYVSGRYVSNQWQYNDDSDVIDSALWSSGNPDPNKGHCVMLTLTGLASVDCAQEVFSVCGHI